MSIHPRSLFVIFGNVGKHTESIAMGDIADMILDGLLDEETGEYIGDHNFRRYGTEAPGFPISLEREYRENVLCPDCGKRVRPAGLAMHRRDVHGGS